MNGGLEQTHWRRHPQYEVLLVTGIVRIVLALETSISDATPAGDQ